MWQLSKDLGFSVINSSVTMKELNEHSKKNMYNLSWGWELGVGNVGCGGWAGVVVEILIVRQAKKLEDLAVQKLLSNVLVSSPMRWKSQIKIYPI